MEILLIKTTSGLYIRQSDIVDIVDNVAYLNNGASVELKVKVNKQMN